MLVIVSFDFGTQEHINPYVIYETFMTIFEDAEARGLKAGRLRAYVNFFDEDGMLQDFARESDGAAIDVVIRKNAYKRKPANVDQVGEINIEMKSTGEIKSLATMYRKYTK